ncbi:hypothetical protein EON83_27070 [bacterium]|nr:MAG: hypothetical protein EON83_27070 [bacterium]
MLTPILLIISNIFMTLAWYGHLKFESSPLWLVIPASWAVALLEYAFQVPANRIGARKFSVTQLKIMQECITLAVFSVIAYFLFGQKLTVNTAISYAFVVAAVYFAFSKDKGEGEAVVAEEDSL